MKKRLSEEEMQYLEEQLPDYTALALKQAYFKSLAAGNEVLIAENGFIYKDFPDGSKKKFRQIKNRQSTPLSKK